LLKLKISTSLIKLKSGRRKLYKYYLTFSESIWDLREIYLIEFTPLICAKILDNCGSVSKNKASNSLKFIKGTGT